MPRFKNKRITWKDLEPRTLGQELKTFGEFIIVLVAIVVIFSADSYWFGG